MPIVSIDWQKIASKLDGSTGIYALTNRQASMLLTLSEQLTWQKTWRNEGYDFSDKDDLDTEIADLQRQLTMPVNLQDIIQYIDDIEDLLTAIKELQHLGGCCDNTAPIGEEYTSPNIENYPDTPPSTWGDGETIADSDDWQELVCGAAHAYVDLLKTTGQELDAQVATAALIVGGVAGLLALLTGAGILLAVSWTVASGIVGGLVAGATATTFNGIEDDLEAGREDIVCAIVHGDADALAAAVEDSVSALAWSLWFSFIDYATAWSTMIDGGNQNGFLEVNRRDDCNCPGPFQCDILNDCSFESGTLSHGWQVTAGTSYEWLTDDPHEGTKVFHVLGGAGNTTNYAYQEFTAPQTGTLRIYIWSRRYSNPYSIIYSFERWNGSSWVELDTANGAFASWEQVNVEASVTVGDQLRLRLLQGSYHVTDDITTAWV